MRQAVDVEQIDRMLEELSQLAKTEIGPFPFASAICKRVTHLLQLSKFEMVHRVGPAFVNTFSIPEVIDPWRRQEPGNGQQPGNELEIKSGDWYQRLAVEPTPLMQRPWFMSADGKSLACWPNGWHSIVGGWILSFEHAPPSNAIAGIAEIVMAFAEIWSAFVLRRSSIQLDRLRSESQRSIQAIQVAVDDHESDYALVHDLHTATGALRVQLLKENGSGQLQVQSMSESPLFDARANVVQTVAEAVQTLNVVSFHSPIFRSQTATLAAESSLAKPWADYWEQGGGEVLLSLSIEPMLGRKVDPAIVTKSIASHGQVSKDCLLFEWKDRDAFAEAWPSLVAICPGLVDAWRDRVVWNAIPSAYRDRALLRREHRSVFASRRAWTIGFLVAAIALWVTRDWSIDMYIESLGTIQPAQQDYFYAPADGYVEALMVEDGSLVESGQAIARVRSPSLELQLQAIAGESNSLRERRSGLQILLSEGEFAARSNAMDQNRVSSEIAEIDEKLESLKQQQTLLESEREKLSIVATRSGTVVGQNLKQRLEQKPVLRGELLFRIARLEGDWNLEFDVPDRDIGHFMDDFSEEVEVDASKGLHRKIEFVVVANPKDKYEATLIGHSNSTHLSRDGQVVVEVKASIDDGQAVHGHVGGTVRGWLPAGRHPWWFVLGRPWIEALQRRGWFVRTW